MNESITQYRNRNASTTGMKLDGVSYNVPKVDKTVRLPVKQKRQTELYPVQSNVPIPQVNQINRKNGCMFPFSKMDVGDSFFVPIADDEAKPERIRSRIYGASKSWLAASGNKGKIKFTSRRTEDGVRFWRIK